MEYWSIGKDSWEPVGFTTKPEICHRFAVAFCHPSTIPTFHPSRVAGIEDEFEDEMD